MGEIGVKVRNTNFNYQRATKKSLVILIHKDMFFFIAQKFLSFHFHF